MAIQQSGQVTPGHLAVWLTTGVQGDGGPIPAASRVLASLRSADFNATTDQPIAIPKAIVAFQLTGIIVTNASPSLSNAIGGFYPQAGKAGTPIVAASQAYSLLTTPDQLLQATLATFGQQSRFSADNLGSIGGLLQIWLSLTTPQGVLASADVYLMGTDLT